MPQSFEDAKTIIHALGFSAFDAEVTDLKSVYLDGDPSQNLFDYLANPASEAFHELQNNISFSSWCMERLQKNGSPIPFFSLVYTGDKKLKATDIPNGLYHFCLTYPKALGLKFEHITRAHNQHQALIFPLGLNQHLTIDALFSNVIGDKYAKTMSYAHLTIQEGLLKTHFYFNSDLELIHFHAYEAHPSGKRYLKPEDIDSSRERYARALLCLEDLQKKQFEQIHQLDLQLNTDYFNLTSQETLQRFQETLAEINRLKSPDFDARGSIIEKLLQSLPKPAAESDTHFMPITPVKTEEKRATPTSSLKKASPKSLVKSQVRAKLTDLLSSLKDLDATIQHVEVLFSKLQLIDMYLLEHFDDFTPEERESFSKRILGFKCLSLKNLHQLPNESRQAIYESHHFTIDSLLIIETSHLLKVHFLLHDEYKKGYFDILSDLIMAFYDKKPLYHFWINSILHQVSMSDDPECLFSGVVKFLTLSNQPNFMIFLARKGLIDPQDCCIVVAGRYFSLLQHILISEIQKNPHLITVAIFFFKDSLDFFLIHNSSVFEKIISRDAHFTAYTLDSLDEMSLIREGRAQSPAQKTTFSDELVEAIHFNLGDFAAAPSQILLHPEYIDFYLNQLSQDPQVLLIYLSKVLLYPTIERKMFFQQSPGIIFFEEPDDFRRTTLKSPYPKSPEMGLKIAFYPGEDKQFYSYMIILAKDLLEKLGTHHDLQDFSIHTPAFEALMACFSDAKKDNRDMIGAAHLAYTLVFSFAHIKHWCPETYKKFFLLQISLLEIHYLLSMDDSVLLENAIEIKNFISSIPDEKLNKQFSFLFHRRLEEFQLLGTFHPHTIN